jgi:diguanylate cyclase (GGDEF)-like protein
MVDSRTQLPDRDTFYIDIQALLDAHAIQEKSLVLLNIEIDKLEFILRTFGPDERDVVIREVGQRIRGVWKHKLTPYHITQGRFALVLADTSYQQAVKQSQLVIDALREPFLVSGVSFHLDAHVGISNYPNHAKSIGDLVRTAAFACHLARERRNDFATFDQQLDEWERHRFRLLMDLEQALQNQTDIQLAYQPLVNFQTGACEGMEGLCRWNHAELGLIAPGNFLPYVEQTPLMLPLTEHTLGVGAQNLVHLNHKGFHGSLAINLSPALFRQPNLLERFEDIIRYHNVDPANLHFEITETGIMEHPNRAANLLQEFRNWGSKVSVDDFGTGHSSLAYLADLPIDIIKIDKHFVQSLTRPGNEAIVGATAMLASKLGLTSIAEGIEDQFQYDKCRELGVTYGQGFFIGKPMPRQDFVKWLAVRETSTV